MRRSERGACRPAAVRRAWTFALVLLLLGGVACSTTGKRVGPRVYSQPRYGVDRFVEAKGYRLHYVEAGQGPPVVLIPGAFTTYRAWDGMLPALSVHHRVLAFDYVGVGDSDQPSDGFGYTVEEQADVMGEAIVALGVVGTRVIGASYGGAVALNLAARYPELVSQIVCIEGGALITPEVLNYSRLGRLIEWPVLGDIIWGFMKSGLFDAAAARSVMGTAWADLTPDARRDVTGVFSANVKTVSRASWMGIYRAITTRIDFVEALQRTRVPVLYLYGEESKYRAVAEMNARRFSERHPNIEVVAFRHGIHDLHLQYPGDVSRLALAFFGAGPGAHLAAGGAAGGNRPGVMRP
jgi:pimeloyl-ACP methyl ester carboxylesterase